MEGKLGHRLVNALRPQAKTYEVWDQDLPGFIVRVMPTGSMTYFCTFRLPDGRRTRIALGRTTVLSPIQARDQAKAILGKVASGIDPVAERRKARVTSVRAFFDQQYGPWVLAHRVSGRKTLNLLNSRFKVFLDKPLPEITGWVIEKWRSERKRSGISAATVNRDVGALRSALSKAVEWDILPNHPLSRVKPLKTDSSKIVRFLSADEEVRLREALDLREFEIRSKRDKANFWRQVRKYPELNDLGLSAFADHIKPMILVLLNTGIRRGELFKVQWGSVDIERRTLTIVGATAKSGATRHIPLNNEALAVLSDWWKQSGSPSSGFVFAGQEGKPMTDIKHAWAGVLASANISEFRLHDIRHDFASKLVMAGVDLNTVRELLGHADLKITLRYAHLAPHVKAHAVARLDRPTLDKIGAPA